MTSKEREILMKLNIIQTLLILVAVIAIIVTLSISISNSRTLNVLEQSVVDEKIMNVHSVAQAIEGGTIDGWSQGYIDGAIETCTNYTPNIEYGIADDCKILEEYIKGS